MNSNYIPLDDCGVMNHIGFIADKQQLKDVPYYEHTDNDWEVYCEKTGFSYDKEAFHVANPTYFNVNKATLKYNKEQLSSCVSDAELRIAIKDICEILHPLEGMCKILDEGEVMLNPQASCGPILSKVFGCENKLEAWCFAADYIRTFWDRAHKLKYKPLWKQAGKVEPLKAAKILNQDIRAFTIIPFEQFMATARMYQDQNDKMCDPKIWKNTPIKHGINLSHRGFNDLIVELCQGLQNLCVIEGDCSKWDSGMIKRIFDAIKEIRFFMWDKKGMSVEEWWERTNHYYDDIVNSCLLLPTGQILMKDIGNPSGQTSTTDDNCLGHLLILCLGWRRLYGRPLSSDLGKTIRIALYADDHVMAINEKAHPEWKSFETRSKIYAALGATLTREKDFVSNSFEGHTFLGLTARWSESFRQYVPHFDTLKAYNSLGKYEKSFSPTQLFERAYTLAHLVSFDDKAFKIIQGYMSFLKTQYLTLATKQVPSQAQCHAYWLGYESVAGGELNGPSLIYIPNGENTEEIETTACGWTTDTQAIRCCASELSEAKEYQKR